MWDEKFETLVRSYLPFLGAEENLDGDLNLRDFGLDSLGIVDLLTSLESTYGVRFSDELLSINTFATPAVLWDSLSKI